MKFEVMPMMAMRQTDWRARTTVNVAPRAPNCGPGILAVVGGILGRGLVGWVCVDERWLFEREVSEQGL